MDEVPSSVSVAREDRRSVAKLVLIDHCQSCLEVVHANDSEHWSEDLVLIDLHLRLHMVEQACAKKKSFTFGQHIFSSIDDQFGTLLFSLLKISCDALQMRFR